MANELPLDFSQDIPNQLTAIAQQERAKLFPKNDYTTVNQYSATNKDAIADGDELGKGTGGYLDVYNQQAGGLTDKVERKNGIKVNKYDSSKTYPDF
jgi:hypothetical protein